MKICNLFILFYSTLFFAQDAEQIAINKILDNWHEAAASADFNMYFDLMSSDAVFIGTDASENWQRNEFMAYAKPYFDKGKAWSFTTVQRNIYFNSTKDFAWFDELLDTQMKLCRGSGVLKIQDGKWKIAHYVLSIAVPNEFVDELVGLKKEKDEVLLINLIKN